MKKREVIRNVGEYHKRCLTALIDMTDDVKKVDASNNKLAVIRLLKALRVLNAVSMKEYISMAKKAKVEIVNSSSIKLNK